MVAKADKSGHVDKGAAAVLLQIMGGELYVVVSGVGVPTTNETLYSKHQCNARAHGPDEQRTE